MATIPVNFDHYNIQPRPSTETDRRHLLAESVAPSESASMVYRPDDSYSIRSSQVDGDKTPRAHSPPASTQRRDTIADPSLQAPRPYRGFPSEAHYLAALNQWAEEKKYLRFDSELKGFYGTTTMHDYAARPKVDLNMGIREKWRARKTRKEGEQARKAEAREGRRNTIA